VTHDRDQNRRNGTRQPCSGILMSPGAARVSAVLADGDGYRISGVRLKGPLVCVAASIAVSTISAIAALAIAARFPDSVPLPVDFAPEGIASGAGSTFYPASLTTGDIYQGDLRTGKGFVLVAPPGGGQGVGLKADVPDHLLFVAGGTTGTAHVYDSRTGALVAQYQFGPNGKSLINEDY
jgi:hypothetical protein